MSQAFKELGFTVQSVDINNDKDAVSPPTLQKDIHDFDPANDLTALPDAVHVSIPCETYSNLSGDHHRVVRDSALLDANLDISDDARQADFLLVKVITILVYIKIRNPHVIIIIENPKAKLRHMPLMVSTASCTCCDWHLSSACA
jgi:site-specific DNA-cytosine methylase